MTLAAHSFELPHDECYLVLFHTPLFMFVRPLALLIFNYLTCFVCFCNKQAFTSRLDRGSKNGHEMMKKDPEVRSNAAFAFERRCGRTQC
jgi:hypothetical protein